MGHDRKKGMKYVCPHRAGKIKCSLLHRCTLKVVWIRPFWEYRRFCSIPRDSAAWTEIYSKRSVVERVNSKLKEHRRLDSHCHRGLFKVRLHCLMSVLSLAITALAEANANHIDRVRACTRKVAWLWNEWYIYSPILLILVQLLWMRQNGLAIVAFLLLLW